MLKLGAQKGLWSFEAALWESLFCFKRAVCRFIISYGTEKILLNWKNQEQYF
jgi:delta-aminolevulinic acid dehydratase/porphobilinogen synthase